MKLNKLMGILLIILEAFVVIRDISAALYLNNDDAVDIYEENLAVENNKCISATIKPGRDI